MLNGKSRAFMFAPSQLTRFAVALDAIPCSCCRLAAQADWMECAAAYWLLLSSQVLFPPS